MPLKVCDCGAKMAFIIVTKQDGTEGREICQKPGCNRPSFVGWGNPVIWVCQECFEAALKNSRAVLERLKRL
jgi:hypothetical protein